ncbi:MAG TPA: PIN domain-containing protein [Salinimicrobium sp.]|nr:PIN domain-containing protein [Salinimicrobium sp.]
MASTRENRMVFLDANCLMTLLYLRPKAKVVADCVGNVSAHVAISVLTVHLIYHFGLKDGYSFKKITSLLDSYQILPIDREVVKLAQSQFITKDFEDCLQAACAEIGDCDEIITLDKKFKKYSGTKLKVILL